MMTLRAILSVTTVVSLILFTHLVSAATITVPGDQPTIQDAIDVAVNGDVIDVAPGTYFENIEINGKAITLKSTDGPETTVIDGGNTTTVVRVVNSVGLVSELRGFTIRNGLANFGAGIVMYSSSPKILGNIIENNIQGGGGQGAGVGGNISSAILEGNIFRNNSCDAQRSSGVIVFVNTSSPLISNNIIENNPCRGINLTLPKENNPAVINNTIVNNDVGIRVDRRVDSLNYFIANNIIAENGIGLEVEFGTEDYNPTWLNNLVYGNDIDYEIIQDQTGINSNISEDPLFSDGEVGDYRLQIGSAAVEAGDNAVPNLPAVDFLGNPRITDEDEDDTPVVDIGAHERLVNDPPVANAGADLTVGTSQTAELDSTGSSDPDGAMDGSDLTFQWYLEGSVIAEGPIATVGPFATGVHTVTLRVMDANGDIDLDDVLVLVANTPPVADAGPDQTVTDTETVKLDGTGSSDPDGDAFTYAWSLASSPLATGPTPMVGPFAVGVYDVKLVVTDEGGASHEDIVRIDVVARPPVAVDDGGQLPSGRSVTIAPLANDEDPSGGGLEIVSISAPNNGAAKINADNTVTYRRNTNFKSGCDIFTYTIADARGSQATGTIYISVGGFTPCGPPSPPPNSPPMALSDNYSVFPGVVLTVPASEGVLTNDYDGDGDPLTARLVEAPIGGILTFNADGSFTFDQNGSIFISYVSFTYVASDGKQDSAPAMVKIYIGNSASNSVHIADLDGTAFDAPKHNWIAVATVEVHDQNHNSVADATVMGFWAGATSSASCTTDYTGRCAMNSPPQSHKTSSVDFSLGFLSAISSAVGPHEYFDDHDFDGDSNGGRWLTIYKP